MTDGSHFGSKAVLHLCENPYLELSSKEEAVALCPEGEVRSRFLGTPRFASHDRDLKRSAQNLTSDTGQPMIHFNAEEIQHKATTLRRPAPHHCLKGKIHRMWWKSDEAAPAVVVGPPRCDFAQQCEGKGRLNAGSQSVQGSRCRALEAVRGAFNGEVP